jgi:Cdc6-like AAA superfamily ATPase
VISSVVKRKLGVIKKEIIIKNGKTKKNSKNIQKSKTILKKNKTNNKSKSPDDSISNEIGKIQLITPRKTKIIYDDSDEYDKMNLDNKFDENYPINISEGKISRKHSVSNSNKNYYDYGDEDSIIFEKEMIIPDNPISPDSTEFLTTSTIFCREKQKELIINFINSQNNNCKSLFVCGQPGTGKTSLILEIFNILTEEEFSFKMYLNCMSVHSIQDFYNQFFKYFNKTENLFKLKKIFEPIVFKNLVSILKQKSNKTNTAKFLAGLTDKIRPIILFDEVDYFYNKNHEILFFDILKIPHLSEIDLKILMISNNSDFDKEILPKIKNCKILIEKCVFEPYSHIEINEILIKKLEESGYMKNFEVMAIRFLSSKLASKSGDIRPALEIIKNIILENKGEFVNNHKIVSLRDMMGYLKYKTSYFVEIIKNLTFEQKLVLVSIYYIIGECDSLEIEENKVKFTFLFIDSNTV